MRTYLLVSQMHDLHHACRLLTAAWGRRTYLVGSVMRTKDWRDVDLRCILDDGDYDTQFPNKPRLELMNAAISQWLAARTGLPIDFQFQRMTQANYEYGTDQHVRNWMGHLFDVQETADAT